MITVLPRTSTPCIVVPAALGRVDAVADEDHLAVLELDPRLHLIGVGDEVGALAEGERRRAAGDGRAARACVEISTIGTSWYQLPLLPGWRPACWKRWAI